VSFGEFSPHPLVQHDLGLTGAVLATVRDRTVDRGSAPSAATHGDATSPSPPAALLRQRRRVQRVGNLHRVRSGVHSTRWYVHDHRKPAGDATYAPPLRSASRPVARQRSSHVRRSAGPVLLATAQTRDASPVLAFYSPL